MNPLLANKETSGMSLAPSAGTPGADCQDGFVYPPVQLETSVPPDVMQLLFPPPPAPPVSTAFASWGLLQLASGVAPALKKTYTEFVQESFQVVSGT
jgi:hypothetical protein